MKDKNILYVSGEESVSQLKIRAERIGEPKSNCYILSENSLEKIFTHIKNTAPELVIVDSIQTIATETVDSSPGSVTQVRECASALLKFAKQNRIVKPGSTCARGFFSMGSKTKPEERP